MSHPLIIRPEAEEDMTEARDWYEEQREGLDLRFASRLHALTLAGYSWAVIQS